MAALRPDDREDGPARGTLSRGVQVYREGILYASVCAPNDLTAGEVVAIVNAESPAGPLGRSSRLRWELSDAETFAGGQTNPCPCNLDAGRTHRLLVC